MNLRPIYLVLLVLSTVQVLVAQPTSRQAKTLLWRIDGNGLQSASYLYGTMHVRDRRAFDFADSVLVAFGRCPVFAAELHLDSAMVWFLRRAFNPDTTSDLAEFLSPETYQRLDEEETAPGDDGGRETFLDAWLHRLAKLQHKQIIGIETALEQVNAFEGNSLEERFIELMTEREGSAAGQDIYERMVRIYRQGDLDALLKLLHSSGMSQEYFDRLLTRRNHVMAERLDTILRKGSTFVAVGAGHLPGAEGLIELLRGRGFRVEPVKVTRTGLARRYHEPEDSIAWFHYVDEELAYTVDMPVEPVTTPMNAFNDDEDFGEFGMNPHVQMTMDISTMTVYMLMSFDFAPGYILSDRDAFLNRWVDRFKEQPSMRKISQKHITLDDGEGYDLTVTMRNRTYYRSLLIVRGNRFHCAMAIAMNNPVVVREAERFASSFHLLPRAQREYTMLKEPAGAFTVRMPGAMRRQTTRGTIRGELLRLQTNAIAADDPSSGVSYVAAWADQPPSAVLYADTTLMSWALQRVASRLDAEPFAQRDVSLDGFPGREYHLKHVKGSTFRLRTYIRGNRIYWLLAGGPGDAASSRWVDGYFDSFRFKEYAPSVWSRQSFDSLGFAITLPQRAEVDDRREWMRRSTPYGVTYLTATDSNSGAVYGLTVRSYSDYARVASIDSIFDDIIADMPGDSTMQRVRAETFFDHPGREVETAIPEHQRTSRSRLVVNGGMVYSIHAVTPEKALHDEATNRFFDSFTLVDTVRADFTSMKLSLLLKDLGSSDTTSRSRAHEALYWFEPDNSELSMLREAVARLYRENPDTIYGSRRGLMRMLGVSADSENIKLIRTLLPVIPSEEHEDIISALIQMNTPAALDLLADFFVDYRPASSDDYALYRLAWTPRNTGVMFPRILALLDSTSYRAAVLILTAEALDSNVILAALIADRVDSIVGAMAQTYAERSEAPTASEGESDTNLPQAETLEESDAAQRYEQVNVLSNGSRCLGHLPQSQASLTILQNLLTDDDNAVRREAAVALLRHDNAVPTQLLEKLASDAYDRLALYRSLDRAGKVDRFPASYHTQEKIAESLLLEWLYNDDDESDPQGVELVSERDLADGKYYVFRFRLGEDGPSYAGVVGPQTLDPSNVNAEPVQGVSDYTEIDALSIEDHINASRQRRTTPP